MPTGEREEYRDPLAKRLSRTDSFIRSMLEQSLRECLPPHHRPHHTTRKHLPPACTACGAPHAPRPDGRSRGPGNTTGPWPGRPRRMHPPTSATASRLPPDSQTHPTHAPGQMPPHTGPGDQPGAQGSALGARPAAAVGSLAASVQALDAATARLAATNAPPLSPPPPQAEAGEGGPTTTLSRRRSVAKVLRPGSHVLEPRAAEDVTRRLVGILRRGTRPLAIRAAECLVRLGVVCDEGPATATLPKQGHRKAWAPTPTNEGGGVPAPGFAFRVPATSKPAAGSSPPAAP